MTTSRYSLLQYLMDKVGFGETPSSPAIIVGIEEEQQVDSRYHNKARTSLSLPRFFEGGRPMSAVEMEDEPRRKSVSFQDQKQYHSWDEDELVSNSNIICL